MEVACKMEWTLSHEEVVVKSVVVVVPDRVVPLHVKKPSANWLNSSAEASAAPAEEDIKQYRYMVSDDCQL